MSKPKLFFLVTEDWFFCSHRLPLAVAAKNSGYDVTVITRLKRHRSVIVAVGLKVIHFELSRGKTNLFYEILSLYKLTKIFRKEKPDLIHNVALKPVIFGSLAAFFSGQKRVLNAITGMGFVFISESFKARFIRFILRALFKVLLKREGSHLVLQNKDDIALFDKAGIISPEKVTLIRGSGVSVEQFYPVYERASLPRVVLASRMLWDKGVGEFVEAAKKLLSEQINAKFILVGDIDQGNPSAISESQIAEWVCSGIVEWRGHQSNMLNIFHQADIICLPSYREGLPKVLLEAAACGLPIITTDVPGCREVICPNKNGLLVPMKNSLALAAAMKVLIDDSEMCLAMGKAGREKVVKEFSDDIVIEQFLACYSRILAN